MFGIHDELGQVPGVFVMDAWRSIARPHGDVEFSPGKHKRTESIGGDYIHTYAAYPKQPKGGFFPR